MAPTSLENIFDEPLEDEGSNPLPPTRPSEAPLFLQDSDDEEAPRTPARALVRKPVTPPRQDFDVEAFFGAIDDDDLMAPIVSDALDAEAVRRDAERRHRAALPPSSPLHAVTSSSPVRGGDGDGSRKDGKKKDEPKEKKKPMRLDENRLLSSDGFPALVKATKDFRITGKGHEAADLNRLFKIYHFWTHQLYPKTPFHDTVERVEKLCHTKRMHVALSVWKDEAQGKNVLTDLRGDTMDVDNDDSNLPRPSSSLSSRPPSSLGPSDNERADDPVPTAQTQEGQAFWDDMEEFARNERPPSAPSSIPPTTSNSSVAEDDFDWDVMDEWENEAAVPPNTSNPSTNKVNPDPSGGDEDMDNIWHD